MKKIGIIKKDEVLKPYFLRYMKYEALILSIKYLYENGDSGFLHLIPVYLRKLAEHYKKLKFKLDESYGMQFKSSSHHEVILKICAYYYRTLSREEILTCEE